MVPWTSRFLFYLLFVSFILLPFANPLSFNFSTFSQENPINFSGDAFLNQNIQLTKNGFNKSMGNSIGRAVYQEPLLLWDSDSRNVTDFTTHFSLRISSAGTDPSGFGDGLAFFLAPYPYIPDRSGGGYLGLLNSSDASKNKVVAVEFDTFRNDWDPKHPTRSACDYCDFHVGIDVNWMKSVAYVNLDNAMISNGRTANATVSYSSDTKKLSVFLRYNDNPVNLSYVLDLKKILPDKVYIGFSASTGTVNETHEILSWDFTSNLVATEKKIPPEVANEKKIPPNLVANDVPPNLVTKEEKKKINGTLMMGIVAAFGMVIFVSAMVWFILWRQKWAREQDLECDESIEDEIENERGPKRYSLRELVAATNNFAKEGKLGEGGFGEVYKGFLGEQVAIKKISEGSNQGKKEYISEVKIINRLRHRNLVRLVGWCHGHGKFLLVYQFMPNGSLDSHLYGEKFLPWPVRHKIALGLANALLYLHEEWEQCVVHRDIKPSNVMLDIDFNAKLGDFGLARLIDHETGSQTTMAAGTLGYLAPETMTVGRVTKESDIYSFGVVALEIACGRRPIVIKETGNINLVEWVWKLYGRRMILEAADAKLEMDFEEEEIERLMIVGLWCAHPDHNLRPSIRQAINVLNFEAPLPDLPPRMPVPTFIAPVMDNNNVSSGMNSVSSGLTANSSSLGTSSSTASSAVEITPLVG